MGQTFWHWVVKNLLDGELDGACFLAGKLACAQPSHWQGVCREGERAMSWQGNWSKGAYFSTEIGGVIIFWLGKMSFGTGNSTVKTPENKNKDISGIK